MEFEAKSGDQMADKTHEVRQLQPAVLAFMGDAVFNLFIRERLILLKHATSHQLHFQATNYVKAASQAKIAKILLKSFNEDESFIFRRGRNAKSNTIPKNADIHDYHHATALEAVLGYLYLTHQNERLQLFLERSASIIEGSESEKDDE